jgi:hypothetical protein
MDIKKIIDQVHEETGTSLGNDDPVFVSVALNRILLEESVKILKNELETSVLKELPDLVIGLRLATVSANNIRNLNGDAENVQELIIKYKSAEDLIDKKIDEINKAASLFNKPFLFTFSGAIVIGILCGLVYGHFTYKESLQAIAIEHDLENLSKKQLEFENQHTNMMLADREGVIFYSDGISIPTNAPDTKTVDGHALYRYPNNNRSPLPKK